MRHTYLSNNWLKSPAILLKIIMLGVFVNPSLIANDDIEEVSSFEPIVKYFESIDARKNPKDEQKIVMFDVDLVLFMPSDQCLHPKFREKTDTELKNLIGNTPVEEYWSHVLETHPRQLVDQHAIPPFLDSLKEKKIKTIAFTNAPTGSYGHYARLEEWRLDELKSFKIDFSYSFPEKPFIEFRKLQASDPNKFPLFKENVLFSNLLPKGNVISPFFQALGGSYDEVISVDDRLKELETEMAACKLLGKKFKGFHYTAALNKPVGELNERRMKYQVKTLVERKKWLSDAEADLDLLMSH